MNINIKTKKNFQTQFNKMAEKYGEEFLKLQGLDDEKLSFTDFIESFIDSDNVANASVDANANIAQKDIVTLLSEMSKPHQKLLAFNKLYYELNKQYGFKTANEAMEAMWNYAVYMHDFNTSTFYHYCYKGEEMLTVKCKRGIFDTTFANLYDIIEDKEEFDESINQYAKFPQELYVRDYNNDEVVWTKVTRLVKHNNNKPMRFIKYANGLSQIVTEDHPIITEDGDIPAIEVTTENRVLSIEPTFYEVIAGSDNIYNKEFGWIVGLCLAEASARQSVVTLKQSAKPQYEKLIYLLNKFHIPFVEELDDRIRLKTSPLEKIIEDMLIGKTAAFKALPQDGSFYPDEFMDGVVAGLIDGDGTIGGYKNRQCQIRIASETLCHQISTYLKKHNVFCGDRTPHIYSSSNSFKQKLPLFGIAFTLTNEEYFSQIGSIKIEEKYIPLERKGNFKNKKYQYNYGWVNIIENTEYIDTCPVVYDITTETGHFICNHILSHNCFAYDIKDIVERGLFFIENYNAKPAKHLDSFIQILMEGIAWLSRRQSGAVGLPNLIPYLYYFWSRDARAGYYTKDPETYKHQQLQALIYRLNQPWVRTDQAAFTNVSIFDHPYFEAIFGGSIFPDGELMIDEEEEIIQFQKDFIDIVNEIREENIFTFPVLTVSLLYQDKKFVDEDFARWACEASRKWNLFNFFTDSTVNSLSNCCRLKSDVTDLYFNSIGGSALKVGSVKVSTLNIARLAYQSADERDFLVALRNLTELNLKILDVQRTIIKRNVEKGLLPSFSSGLVDFEHLYSTVGVNGIYEAIKTFGYIKTDEFGNTYYTDEAFSLGRRIFDVIRNCINNFSLDKDYKFNIEQAPAEQAAAKMQAADKFLYPEKVVEDLPLYGNQWIPLGIKATVLERTRICAAFDSYCNGGSIEHINVDKPFSEFDTAWEMLNWVAQQGVTYFAFNGKVAQCKNFHSFYGKVCPVCGEPVETEYTRVVGFYTPTKTYSKERKAEFNLREWLPLDDKGADA